tara:strand:- start:4359 stop:4538 length:180 start_codon:yes stop_codon:yes gene_type:complete
MKSFKQFKEGLRKVGDPVSAKDMINDIKIIDDTETNPLKKQLRHAKYRNYIDQFGLKGV